MEELEEIIRVLACDNVDVTLCISSTIIAKEVKNIAIDFGKYLQDRVNKPSIMSREWHVDNCFRSTEYLFDEFIKERYKTK